MAFINGQFQEAFTLAKEAIKLDENCADAYQCAANVCMSLGRYEDAIEYYQKAVNCDPNNGNRFFSLGYAQASVNKIAEVDEITNGLQTANQMKLLAPSDYSGYQAAYILLKQAGRIDDAFKELRYQS
ncbi:MAG: tetratricopeptide repeat protein [Clostridium sp.]|nr:tetratricopeptide repeat protein [Clostridium sp.]